MTMTIPTTTMTLNQAIIALGFKPITYSKKEVKVVEPQVAKPSIKKMMDIYNKNVLRGQQAQTFLTDQWAYLQTQPVNRFKVMLAKQDMFFTPNRLSGRHRSEKEVNSFNNFYVDWDAGKDENDNYLPLEEVDMIKAEMYKVIKTTWPLCTAIEKTRNGFHIFFSIKEGTRINLKEWKKVQAYIISKTGSDENCKDGARLMKIPYTYASKKGDYAPYLTSLIEANDISYTPDELVKAFDHVVAPVICKTSTAKKSHVAGAIDKTFEIKDSTPNIAAIKNNEHQYFTNLFKRQAQRMSRSSFKSYLKTSVDIGKFLGKPKHFCCIFHPDNNPSAVILPPTGKKNSWNYYCHSDNCDYKGSMDIIDVTMAIAGVAYSAAINFLAKCFNIIIPQGKKGRHIDDMLRANDIALDTIRGEKAGYDKSIKPFKKVYGAIAGIAKKTAEMTNTFYYGQDVFFSASKRFIARLIGGSDSDAHRKTVWLAAIGLIEKVADEDLPESIKQRDYVYKRNLETFYGNDRTIQYYKLLAIDSLRAMQAVKKQLDKWIAGKGQIKIINERLITGIFGYDVAAAIYAKKIKKETANANQHSSQYIFA